MQLGRPNGSSHDITSFIVERPNIIRINPRTHRQIDRHMVRLTEDRIGTKKLIGTVCDIIYTSKTHHYTKKITDPQTDWLTCGKIDRHRFRTKKLIDICLFIPEPNISRNNPQTDWLTHWQTQRQINRHIDTFLYNFWPMDIFSNSWTDWQTHTQIDRPKYRLTNSETY